MNAIEPTDGLDELRQANPVDRTGIPSASLARLRARVIGRIDDERRAPDRTRRQQAWLLVGGTVISVLLVLVGAGAMSMRAPGKSPSAIATGTAVPSATSGTVIGACLVPFNLESLAERSIAFDGTVTAIREDTVTFRVNADFRGVDTTIMSLASATAGGGLSPNGEPAFVLGRRYLVSGEDGFAWSCGFSQPYDEAMARTWAAVFSR